MNIHIKSILAALAFSFLFYSNNLGLNLFFIAVIVVILLITLKRNKPISWKYYCLYLLSSVFVFINPTAYSIFIHFMTFILLIGKFIAPKNSLYISWLIGLINMLVASAANFNKRERNPEKKKEKAITPKTLNYIKGIVIAIGLLFLFTLLYKNANPVFNTLISKIDLNFISIPWLFFTFLGYILFLHILNPYHPKELIDTDNAQNNYLVEPTNPFSEKTLKKLGEEHILGSIVFGTLNLLLIFFLTTDVIYLLKETTITNAAYSESVHQGVYALMFSIVCAIVLILYFFRGNLNFFQDNKRLKSLTFLWIGLNLILVTFTSYKNYQYVEALGFTYKRIGVFVYLLLTIIGLITAYIKVTHIKNFVYLVRTNIAVFFALLFISAAIPWDKMITSYNLSQIKNPDINYLINLGDTNSKQLYIYTNKNNISNESKQSINTKYTNFIAEYSNLNWQEYTLYQFTDKNIK